MSDDGLGYLIPDPVDPGSFRCIKVWIPDDDLYLYAFMGAYGYLTKWVAWERDPLKRGKDAAALWRQALELTTQEGYDCMTDITPIVTAIENCCTNIDARWNATNTLFAQLISKLESVGAQLSINLDCIPCDETVYDDPPPDPPYDPGDPPGGDIEDFLAYLCVAAQYIYDVYVLYQLNHLWQQSQTLGGLFTYLSIMVALTIPGVGFPLAIAMALLTWFLVTLAAGDVDQTLDDLAAMRSEILCAIYSSTSGPEALTKIAQVIDSNQPTQEAADWLYYIFNNNTLNGLYNMSVSVPPDYLAVDDCSGCQSPAPAGEWYVYNVDGGTGTSMALTSTSISALLMTGTITRASTTGMGWDVRNTYDYTLIDAVTFTLTEYTVSPSMGCDGSNGVFFGPVNNSYNMCADYFAGATFCFYLTGTTPPTGTWDYAIEVQTRGHLIGRFAWRLTGYQPAGRTVTVDVDDFTVYPTP